MTLVIDVSCKGSSSGQRILLEDGETLNVGRANESLDLVADPRLSRKHFILRYCNREIEITHLSRTNPTLVASEGSTDFTEVNGKQVEASGCRIIAGSHRFVAVVEAPDSIIEPTLSGEDQAEIWSDVDSQSDGDPFFDSFAESNGDSAIPDIAPAKATMPSPIIDPIAPSAVPTKPAATSNKLVFSLGDEAPQPSSASDTAKPKLPPAVKTSSEPSPSEPPKKIFFPVEDDFFD